MQVQGLVMRALHTRQRLPNQSACCFWEGGRRQRSSHRLWEGRQSPQIAHHAQALRQLDGPRQPLQQGSQHGTADRLALLPEQPHNLRIS